MRHVTETSDARIAADVVRALDWTAFPRGARIEVAVDAGAVTLSGIILSRAKRHAAEAAVRNVHGVGSVRNELTIDGARPRSDAAVTEAVHRALARDMLVPDRTVRASVRDGCATLCGTVTSPLERDEAERAVWRVPGVSTVYNEIAVWPADVESSVVRAMLEGAVAGRSESAARRVDVTVSDGVAVLTGRVRSPEERRLVISAAERVPGVRAVRDCLHVESGD